MYYICSNNYQDTMSGSSTGLFFLQKPHFCKICSHLVLRKILSQSNCNLMLNDY